MLKKLTIILLSISPCCQGIWGQKEILNQFSNIDNTVNLIPDSLTKSTQGIANYIISNFDNENDRVRAVFSWIAHNVEYDIEDMFVIDIYEKKEDKISKILRTKKGTCDHYSLLFNEICSQIGIRSYIVDGYTKQNNLVDNLPHS